MLPARNCCGVLDLCGVFEGDELAKVFDSPLRHGAHQQPAAIFWSARERECENHQGMSVLSAVNEHTRNESRHVLGPHRHVMRDECEPAWPAVIP